jgi:hypothetical protein
MFHLDFMLISYKLYIPQLIDWARTNFESVRTQMGKDAKKAKKTEEKLSILTKVTHDLLSV